MNMLVYRKPALAQKIVEHITHISSWDRISENYHPFIVEMPALKEACENILNPFKDILGIFHSEDKDVRYFATQHQIVPETGEIFSSNDGDSFHVVMNFFGTEVNFHQEGVTKDFQWHDIDDFSVEASEIMKKFSLETPQEIYPYLKEHYNNKDCFYQLHKEFNGE